MDDYYDYDDDEDNTSAESDYDEVKFVSSSKKFKYTTFGDNRGNNNDQDDADQIDGREESIYGIFAENRRSISKRVDSPTSAPLFVRAASPPSSENLVRDGGDDDRISNSAPTSSQAGDDNLTIHHQKLQGKDDEEANFDEEGNFASESLRKQQEEANQKFMALLKRGRGEKRPRSILSRDRASSEMQQSEQSGDLIAHPRDGALDFDPDTGGGVAIASPRSRKELLHDIESLPSRFGSRPPTPPIKVDPNLGKWEKHTKGIGMKLLTKMGYSGSGGLGFKRGTHVEVPRGSGISRPIEVVVRPTNLGLGFGNFKEATKLMVNKQVEAEIRGEKLSKQEEEESRTNDLVTGQPRKSSAFPTSDELISQQAWKRGASKVGKNRRNRTIVHYTELLEKNTETSIIDMRGPQSVSNVEDVPLAEELLHNLSILLNTYENKLHASSHFAKTSTEKVLSLQSDLTAMERRRAAGRERIAKLKRILQVVDSINDLVTASGVRIDMVTKIHTMVEGLRGELSADDVGALQFDQVIVPSLLSPFISSCLDQWNPLDESSEQTEAIVTTLLNLGGGIDDADVVQERKLAILSRSILPHLKAAYESTQWNPTQKFDAGVKLYERLLSILDKHEQHVSVDHSNVFAVRDPEIISLTDTVTRDLLRKTIFPKLMRVLSQWNATLDRTATRIEDALELWLLPWIPHIDHPTTVSQLTLDLKRKVRSALSCLNRGVIDKEDFLRSSIATLSPWRKLFKKEVLVDLTSKYISPKLTKMISSISIESNPDHQDWFLVKKLNELYETGLMLELEYFSLLEGELLAKWTEKLHSELEPEKVIDTRRLIRFYLVWKDKVFGSPSSAVYDLLCRDEFVCRIFYSGIKLIEVSVTLSNDVISSRALKTSNFREVMARRYKDVRNRTEDDIERLHTKDAMEFRKQAIGRQFGATVTFREVLEDFAKENDIPFRPRTVGKTLTNDGKQIYLFGEIPIYLDSNVIFVNQGNTWNPHAMEHLVQLAKM